MSRLEQAIATGRFVVTAELRSVDAGDLEGVRKCFTPYADWVDAINVTDNGLLSNRRERVPGRRRARSSAHKTRVRYRDR